MRGRGRVLVLVLACLAPRAEAAEDAASELRGAEARRRQATVAADGAALEELLGDELRFVHANGQVVTKRAYIDALTSGRLDYVSIRPGEVEARVLGDAGVVTGTADLEVRAAGGPVQSIRNLFLAVYARRDGAWRLVAYQSTRAPAGR